MAAKSKIKIKGTKETIDIYDKSFLCFGETMYLGPGLTTSELPDKFWKALAGAFARAKQEGINSAKDEVKKKYRDFLISMGCDNKVLPTIIGE